ncbi:MAG: KH domain-containing protein [Deltaproteobacteria bacterium]|nr:KH domain-containing protein [Deltaproteobacteria bacterium]
MEKLVEYVAKALVDHPENVVVEVTHDSENEMEIALRVDPEDRGRVIGKNGRTAHAIRTLLAAAAPQGRAVMLEIVD